MTPLGCAPPRAAVMAALALACALLPAPPASAQTGEIAEAAAILRPQARPATLAALPAASSAPPAEPPPDPDPDGTPLAAAQPAPPAPGNLMPAGPTLGPETNLPLPRYVSLKTDEGNVRRGPSLSHRIDWVFVREGMPLLITAEYGHWRRVVDREGLGGWVHYSMLSGSRTVIVDQDMLPIRASPAPDAPEIARLEQGVIARLDRCGPDWCRISAGGSRGWAPKPALWGVGADEIPD